MNENLHVTERNNGERHGVPSMPPADEKLKLFFLEEARMLCPATRVNCSDYSKMYALYQRLKRIVRLFNLLYEHNWGEFFPDIQKAFGFYLLEGYASKKERFRIIEMLSKEIAFVTKAAQFNDFIAILQEHFTHQLSEIERMLDVYYPPEAVNPFPAP